MLTSPVMVRLLLFSNVSDLVGDSGPRLHAGCAMNPWVKKNHQKKEEKKKKHQQKKY